ncbi:MAG: pentapeptide repeat-containing protein [Leptospiraceae bacterium]|nr:pentapeptide repeat-containing protein [Leptospiraceae bacterium]MDW8306679.1 pentapeptide repeat-containing protein [Leptospiraceae bacterium]
MEQRPYYGELEQPSVVSEYKNAGCGDGYRLYLKIKDDRIEDIRYTTTGCSFSLVSLSIICDLAKGKRLNEALAITPELMESYIDGYPERRKNYAETAIKALQKAIRDYENGTGLSDKDFISKKKILELLREKGSLANADLRKANLDHMDLSYVDFTNARLEHTFFSGSKLTGANFSHAKLTGAYLNNCDLTHACFENADLRFTKLTGSKLDGASFKNALYDVGTRVDQKYLDIFSQMRQQGKEIYLKAQ